MRTMSILIMYMQILDSFTHVYTVESNLACDATRHCGMPYNEGNYLTQPYHALPNTPYHAFT